MKHVIDPTYFWDAIEEFSFNFLLIRVSGKKIDDEGYEVDEYSFESIRGSFQSTGTQLIQSKTGNTKRKGANFYCKSLYRINIGDIIYDRSNCYRVDELFDDYDEYGVRAARMTMIKLVDFRNLQDYILFLEGHLAV